MSDQVARSRWMPRVMWWIVVLSFVGGGASCQPAEGGFVRNSSGQTLRIEIVDHEVTPPLVGSGNVYQFIPGDRECLGSGVIARTEAGEEFARLDEPLCNDDKWIIDRDGARLGE